MQVHWFTRLKLAMMLSLYFIDAETIEAIEVDWSIEWGHLKYA